MGLCEITGSHWLVGRRVSGEGGRGVKKTGGCWSVRVRNKKCDMFVLTLIKLQIREEAPCRL